MPQTLRRSTFIAATAAAAVAVAAGTAFASTVVTPAGQAVTASSSNLSFKMGALTLACTSTTSSGTIPTSPANSNAATGGININIGTPTLTGCKANGVIPATIATSGLWQLNVSGDNIPSGGAAEGFVVVPAGGAVITVPGLTCTITIGASTIGPLPFDSTNQRVVAKNTGAANYTITGTGSLCSGVTTGIATMSGSLQFSSPTPINVTG